MSWIPAAIKIGSKIFSSISGNKASAASRYANAARMRLMALKNARERRQLIRQSYIARAQVAAGAGAADGDGGLAATPVLGSLYSILGQQQTELDFLTRAGQLETEVAKWGGAADAATQQGNMFSAFGNIVDYAGSKFPMGGTDTTATGTSIDTGTIFDNPSGGSTEGYS